MVPNAVPVFAKARSIPYGLQNVARELLNDLILKRVIRQVDPSEWASPIVLFKKTDGSYRLCINPSRTLNPWLSEDHYPLPSVDDLLLAVGGHQFYSSVDLTGAFQQLRLTPRASKLVTIATPFGYYEFLRLPFGIKTASAIFQRAIDGILRDIVWAKAYIDDIIIFANSEREMWTRLNLLFKRLSDYNVQVNFSKCTFCGTGIHYLGHALSRDGVAPSTNKISEILEAKPPQDLKYLQSFLGMVSYLRKFVAGLSELENPLLQLLKKNVPFVWGPSQQRSFDAVKSALKSTKILMHYDPQKDPILCTDASDVGISAVLCHEYEGDLRPVWCKSRTLDPAEKNYPILHRELLAVVYGCEEFYKFVFGRRIILITDHKPLIPLIKNGLTMATASTRVQRYLIRFSF